VFAERLILGSLAFGALSAGAMVGVGCGDDDPTVLVFGDWTPAFDAQAEGTGWLLSVWGPSASDLFAVGGPPGSGTIMRRRSGAWAPMELPATTPTVNWVYGFSEDDVWAVGDGGTALHFDGAAWRPVATPTDQNLWGVWGAAPDDLWAVGGGTTPPSANAAPTALRWDGTEWRSVEIPALVPTSATQLFKVWGSGPDDVLLVGARGVILRWDGAALTQDLTRPVAHTDDYVSLWGTGPDRIAIAGGRANAQIAVWDGATWIDAPLPRNPGLNGIWMGRPDIFHVVGVRGIAATLRLEEGSTGLESSVLQQELVPDIPGIDLHAVFGTSAGQLIAVGGNFGAGGAPYEGAAVVAPLIEEEPDA
jgi:hypothetical protein